MLENIKQVLARYVDPYHGQNLLASKTIKNIQVKDANATIDLVFGYPISQVKDAFSKELQALLVTNFPNLSFNLNLSWQVEPRTIQSGLIAIPQVKNIIAVASGKGGVGKSTTTVNVALALAAQGAAVGILDADIYGPNLPHMLGVTTTPEVQKNKKFQPIMAHGIQSMSIGYLVDVKTPMIWRGPMVSTALKQLLNDTTWRALDYLFIDLPPGTGDIQLTLAQKVPVSGAIIVTTPQDVALADARKSIEMFYKVKVPILGVIENMSTHICHQCGHQEEIFGQGGGERMANEYQAVLLGQLPLRKQIREQADRGYPLVLAKPDSMEAKIYMEIARKVTARLSLQARDYSSHFSKIVVEKT